MAARFQHVPLVMHFQYVPLGVAAWNKRSNVVCPAGSVWQLPGPMAL